MSKWPSSRQHAQHMSITVERTLMTTQNQNWTVTKIKTGLWKIKTGLLKVKLDFEQVKLDCDPLGPSYASETCINLHDSDTCSDTSTQETPTKRLPLFEPRWIDLNDTNSTCSLGNKNAFDR